MKLGITYDADARAKLDEVIFGVNDEFEKYFGDRFYDDSALEIFLVLMCRNPHHSFNQRIKFSKKDNCLYLDIMLDLNEMGWADPTSRRRIVGEKIATEVPQIVARYKFKGFDLKRFSSDLRAWFEQTGWILGI